MLRVLDPLTKKPACKHFERAAAWQEAGGSVPRSFCARCDGRNTCLARGPDGFGRVDMTVHALLPETTETKALIFDESPTLFEELVLSEEDVDRAFDLLDKVLGKHVLTNDYQRRITPWLRVVEYAWADPDHDVAAAAKRFASNDCGDGRTGARAIADAFEPRCWDDEKDRWTKPDGVEYELPSGDPLRDVVRLAEMAGEVALRDEDDVARVHGRRWDADLEALRIFRALGAAAVRPRWHVAAGETVLVGLASTRAARALQERGGIVLDATPSTEALRALNPKGVTLNLGAADGAAITRVVYYATDFYRRKLVPGGHPDWPRILPMLRRSLEDARVAGVRKLLVVTYQDLVSHLEENDEARALLEAWRRAGREIDLAHYGAVRELNRWQDYDGALTLGDAWRSKPSAIDEADALGLEDFGPAYVAAARGELAQAHGRLRDVRRSTPAWHAHIGQLAPDGWGPDTRIVMRPLGRRPVEHAVDPGPELRGLVEAVGGVRAAARILGVAGGTVGDWLSGRRPVPADMTSRLRLAVVEADGATVGGAPDVGENSVPSSRSSQKQVIAKVPPGGNGAFAESPTNTFKASIGIFANTPSGTFAIAPANAGTASSRERHTSAPPMPSARTGRPAGDHVPGAVEQLSSLVVRIGSNRAAASALGVSPGSIGDWLSGRRPIPSSIAEAIAGALGDATSGVPSATEPRANTCSPAADVPPERSARLSLADDGVCEVVLTPPVARAEAAEALAALGLLVPGRRIRLRDAAGAYELAA